jgi:HK97 family phage portal protein
MGEDNAPLTDAVELVNVTNAGVMSAVKNGSVIRGILKILKKAIREDEIKKRRDEFITQYGVTSGNDSGIAGLDADMEYNQIDASKMYTIPKEQMQEVREGVYRYFGINEGIVTGKFSEDDWNAFYEGVLEPIAIQLSQEFTQKLFTPREQALGNEIMFEANRLQYASAQTKINLVDKLGQLGLLTINEGREIFNLPAVEDGEKRLQSLNYVNANKADQYQLGAGDDTEKSESKKIC